MIKWRVLGSAICLIMLAALPFDSRPVQVNAQHIISTKAGFISRIRGEVFIQRARGGERERVAPNLQMADGDRLGTEAESRAEILLNPQAYLRLDEQAEVRALNTLLTEARFELRRGTVMIEVDRMDKSLAFEIITPHGSITLSKTGLCRISLEASSARIDVLEGEITLGAREQALSKTATRIGDGKRVELKSGQQTAPVITPLARKPFDEFDRWSFQIAKYGAVRRLEAGVQTICRGQEPEQLCPVSADFQLKADEWLLTEADSYVELRLNRGVFLRLNQQSRLQAIKTDTDEAVFELNRGAVIVETNSLTKLRPLKIVTSEGTFMIERGSLARFDVNPSEATVSVWYGQVRMEARGGSAAKSGIEIGHGKRLQLTSSNSPSQRVGSFDVKALDAFDRWSFRLAVAGYLYRFEGKVHLARRGGTKLELDKYPPRTQAQLWGGDRLMTAQGGRAELWLNPRTILHLNEESEIRLVSTADETPQVELMRGAVIVHVWTPDFISKKMMAEISTPHGSAFISESGDYRIEVDATGTRINVRLGALLVGSREQVKAKTTLKVREKEVVHLVAVNGRAPERTRLTAAAPDDFDSWSRLFLERISFASDSQFNPRSGPKFGSEVRPPFNPQFGAPFSPRSSPQLRS